ncbi:PH domain-containing protein [Aliivibrio logei]|uniref:YokE-like PH domain-containing protein n=1 Tax=Aliivibrio logei 5S-186 TaxID=626086 RepID=A0ABX3ARP2_ALILO|nr:PH domain-containing protein [Aliivibrio logei]OEF10834.1 hypothetical protein A1Q5_01515 [Aliivibrio logei 5S-186]
MAKELKHVTKYRDNHLKLGESIIAWGEGYIGDMMGGGDKKQQNGALIVTNSLVIFYRKGFLGEVLESIPLKGITSIERKSILGHRTISMHTSHDDLTFKCLNKEHEQRLIKAIDAGRDSKIESLVAEESSLDKIKKLADLKDAGILTVEEFEIKKDQLLQKI